MFPQSTTYEGVYSYLIMYTAYGGDEVDATQRKDQMKHVYVHDQNAVTYYSY